MKIELCPDAIRKATESECKAILEKLRRDLNLAHMALAFASDDRFLFRTALMTDQEQVFAALKIDEGLMGHCLKTGQIWCYPDDPVTKNIIRSFDQRPIAHEVVAPVFYNGAPSAVLLIDFFEGEKRGRINGQFRERIKQATCYITDVLESYSKSRQELRDSILKIVKECQTSSLSLRGYLAIKGWDGKLEYLTTDGDDGDRPTFLALNQTEGLCGRVFQNGEPLTTGNVWEAEGYVASDTKVMSESIYPVRLADKTVVAVLNMESYEPNFYDDNRRMLIRASAESLVNLVDRYRSSLSAERPDTPDAQHAYVSDFIEQATTHFRPLKRISAAGIHREITGFIRDKLSRLFKAEKSIIWNTETDPPVEMKGLKRGERMQEGCIFLNGGDSARKYLVYSPLRIEGQLKAVIGFITAERPPEAAPHVAEQFCRIGSSIAESTIENNRSVSFEDLIRNLLAKKDRKGLSDVVQAVPSIIDCDHCTVLGVKRIGEQQVLAPLASSSELVFKDHHSHLFYRMGPDQYDGYTGYVAMTGKLFLRYPPLDSERNKPVSEGEPSWAQKTSEVREELAAIIIMPIMHREANRVIGVLRVIRTKRHRKAPGPLEPRFLERLETICMVLGEMFGNSGLISSAEPQLPRKERSKSKQNRVLARRRAKHHQTDLVAGR